jgi:hypothetical protein
MDEHAPRHGGLRGRHLVAIAAVATLVLAGVLWFVTRGPQGPREPPPTRVERVQEGSRTVTLYFAGADEPVVVSEPREVAVGRRIDEQLRQVVDALLAGPEDPKGLSAIPPETRLLAVMVDTDSATVYLDFERSRRVAPGAAPSHTVARRSHRGKISRGQKSRSWSMVRRSRPSRDTFARTRRSTFATGARKQCRNNPSAFSIPASAASPC